MTVLHMWRLHLPHPYPVATVKDEPGGSSQRRYDSLLREWRRKNRRLFIVVGAACAAILVASAVAGWVWPGQRWTAGFLGGAAAAFFVLLRLSPPGWIENWQQGAWGEEATAKTLRPLEKEGWVVLHDRSAKRGNLDHIVIGPGGLFLLDSKRLGGCVSIDSRGILVHRYDDPDLDYHLSGGDHLLALARESHDSVLELTRISQWVTPVMVIWAEFPQRIVDHEKCCYVHGADLADWLRTQPPTIALSRIEQIAAAVGRSLPPHH